MDRRRTERSERGAAVVEFALLVPVLCMLLFGIISFGIIFANDLAMGNGAREAARFGVVDGRTCTNLFTDARDASSSINVTQTAVQVTVYRGATKAAAKAAAPICSVSFANSATNGSVKPCQGSASGDVLYVLVEYHAKLVIPLAVVDPDFPVSGEGVFRCEFS